MKPLAGAGPPVGHKARMSDIRILSGTHVRDVLPLPIDEVLMLLEVFNAGWLVEEVPRHSTGWAGELQR